MKKKLMIIGAVLTLLISGCGNNNTKKDVDVIENTNIEEIDYLTNIEISLGDNISSIEDFGFKETDGEIKLYLNDEIVDTIDKIGTYKAEITIDDKVYTSEVVVLDKESPTLKLKDVSIKVGKTYQLKDFVESCNDNSKEECVLAYTKEEMGKYTKAGTYDIEISAKDSSNNERQEKAKLTITENKTTTNTNQNNNNNNSNNNQNTTTNNSNTNETTNNNTSTNTSNDSDIISQATKNAAANTAQVNEVLKYTNDIRTKLGLPNLTLSSSLTKAAMVRAIEISTKFAHTRPDGTSYSSVFKELNITVGYSGENIAAGRQSAKTTVDDWEGSPGHYANIINTNYTKMGVGYVYIPGTQYKYYWVQLFSS